MPKVITDKELNVAAKLASRRDGVTRKQLAEKLGVTEGRAKIILEKAPGLFSRPAGEGAGKANRALVFSTTKPATATKSSTKSNSKVKTTKKAAKRKAVGAGA